MSTHANIIKLLTHLDYTTRTDGFCYGVSLRWLEACLLGSEAEFDNHISEMVKNGQGLVESNNARKANKPIFFTKQQLETLAFCDSLELYQHPGEHASLFGEYVRQEDVKTIPCLASSDDILSRGGLAQIYTHPGIYTKTEIVKYFDDLAAVIKNSAPLSKETFGIILSNHNHAIAMTYKPGSSDATWQFMDINQYPSQSFKAEDTALIAERLILGFQTSKNSYSTFNTSVFTLGNNEQLDELKRQLGQFKKQHVPIKEIASRVSHENNLVFIAAKDGDVPVIAELAEQQVNLDIPIHGDVTPAYIAAQIGHAGVIAELAKRGAILNRPVFGGVTSLHAAAQNGHAHVIAELMKQGVDPDIQNNNGSTPAYFAAQYGHAHVIAELGRQQKTNFNLARQGGATPAYIAAQMGHVHVIAELAKQGADLNIPEDDGGTPAFVAAHYGHASVIAELEKTRS